MIVKRGRMTYVPPAVLDEIEDIKREDDILKGTEAFRKLVKYARVGRETKRLATLNFSKSVPRVSVDAFPFKQPKKKWKKQKSNNLFGRGII